ncbi:MAG: nitrate reductase [Deltaproteobacteria bacterium]|nr:nitrate reductase [Deltaproteobacteria bacterium]
MTSLYEFLAGPGAWISFVVFGGGLLIRLAFLAGLSRERDSSMNNHVAWDWGLKSVFHGLLPLGTMGYQSQPVFSVMFFIFHVCLLAAPIFLSAHNILFAEAFGWSLPTLPDAVADWLTVGVIVSGLFLFIRRLARAEVRLLTGAWDYLLLLLTLAPFVFGFLAYHQIGDYDLMLVLHVGLGELLLIILPFSKLGHLILFFFSRVAIGFEMGGRRGARSW